MILLAAIVDWIVRLFRPPRDAAAETDGVAATVPVHPEVPPPLHNRFGGRAWRFDEKGVFAEGKLWRTAGAPTTCRSILALYGQLIRKAAQKHGVAPALIVMTIAAETGGLHGSGFTGPRSFRWEPHVVNRDVVPAFKGSYSAGPMQILATTAREIIAKRGKAYDLAYEPFAIAPAYPRRPRAAPPTHPLYDPAKSIDLGTAVIRRQLALTGEDPILVAAAYNSGGLYESRSNAWRLRSHGDHLDRAARWYGDACAVLSEAGWR